MHISIQNLKDEQLSKSTVELYQRAKQLSKLIRLTCRKQDERFSEYERILRALAIRDQSNGELE